MDLVNHQGGFGKPYCRVARNQGSLDGSNKSRRHLATGVSFDHLLFEAIPGGGVAAPAASPLHVLWGLVHWLAWSGKTPALISMLLAMGRYHIHRLQADGVPGCRCAKSLDGFRHQIGQVYEGIFLDDPHRDSISIADLKSFLTVEGEQTTSGRYNDAKLIRNCMRAYASNDLDQSDEPEDDSRTSITGEEFLKLTRRIFAGDKHADVLACLKRAVVIILGHLLYTCACPVRILLPRCIASRWMTFTKTFWLKRTSPSTPSTSWAFWSMAPNGKEKLHKKCI